MASLFKTFIQGVLQIRPQWQHPRASLECVWFFSAETTLWIHQGTLLKWSLLQSGRLWWPSHLSDVFPSWWPSCKVPILILHWDKVILCPRSSYLSKILGFHLNEDIVHPCVLLLSTPKILLFIVWMWPVWKAQPLTIEQIFWLANRVWKWIPCFQSTIARWIVRALKTNVPPLHLHAHSRLVGVSWAFRYEVLLKFVRLSSGLTSYLLPFLWGTFSDLCRCSFQPQGSLRCTLSWVFKEKLYFPPIQRCSIL